MNMKENTTTSPEETKQKNNNNKSKPKETNQRVDHKKHFYRELRIRSRLLLINMHIVEDSDFLRTCWQFLRNKRIVSLFIGQASINY